MSLSLIECFSRCDLHFALFALGGAAEHCGPSQALSPAETRVSRFYGASQRDYGDV